jgi:hypothetical protein
MADKRWPEQQRPEQQRERQRRRRARWLAVTVGVGLSAGVLIARGAPHASADGASAIERTAPALGAAPGATAERAAGSATGTAAEPRFTKTVLDREFRSEGVAVGDVNHDGRLDVLAGNLWYEAPNWTPHEIAPLEQYDREKAWSKSFLDFAFDVNHDGWIDEIVIGYPGEAAVWRENPRGAAGHWASHILWRSACNESPAFAPLWRGGPPMLVFAYDDSFMAWFEPPASPAAKAASVAPGSTGSPASPGDPFVCHTISEAKAAGTGHFSHGLGVGDVNGDGRADIMTTKGYWAAPEDPRKTPWTFVPAALGPDSAQMFAYDVNGDGLPDVLASSAHNKGVWWFEQRRGANGAPNDFVQHTIDDSFSESHGAAFADINGDGVPDFVTGKRFWAHGPTGDVDASAPAVLYWFEFQRKNGQVTWQKHLIDDNSGVGEQVVVADLDKDKRPDIIIANKNGVFVFHQTR